MKVLGLAQDGDDVNVFVAVHYSQRYYLTVSQRTQNLTTVTLETAARVTIAAINYNPCSGAPCERRTYPQPLR